MTITIELKGKIIPKARPRVIRNGNKTWGMTPRKTKDFESYVKLATRAQIKEKIHGAVAVKILIKKKPPKTWSQKRKKEAIDGEILATAKPDVDNYAKSIIDGMSGVAFRDDSFITELTVKKQYAATAGATIEITAISGKTAY